MRSAELSWEPVRVLTVLIPCAEHIEAFDRVRLEEMPQLRLHRLVARRVAHEELDWVGLPTKQHREST